MNGVLTNGRVWRFVRIEGDTLYHFDIILNSKLTSLPRLLHYLCCFAKGEAVPCDLAQWPPASTVSSDPNHEVELISSVPPTVVCISSMCFHHYIF